VFALQALRLKLFKEKLANVVRYGSKDNLFVSLVSRSTILGSDLLMLIIIGAGAFMTIENYLSLGSLIGFLAYFRNVTNSIENVAMSLPNLINASSRMQRIQKVLSAKSMIKKRKETKEIPKLKSKIIFNDVAFGYEHTEPICSDLNFEIKERQSVAIVGSSGSGKSTILSLLLHLHDPDKGKITIDNENLKDAAEGSLRKQIGMVLQESLLFNTSIKNNILIGKPTATDEEVILAAKESEIHDTILSFSQGYDTNVGELGSRLSLGQRQRIAIARTFIRNPSILVLDEPTMSLDPVTETAINKTIEKISKDRTVISVTHRLSTVTKMDQIFVIKDGKIIEKGTHEELLKLNGFYAELWEKQTGVSISPDGLSAKVKPSLLKAIPLLKSLDKDTLEKLADRFIMEQYDTNKMIFDENEQGDKFYIIARGKVDVLRKDITGEKKSVAILDDGDYFGEIALLENVRRTAEVHTLSPCIFLTLQSQQFNKFIDMKPEIRKDFEKVVAKRRKELREFDKS